MSSNPIRPTYLSSFQAGTYRHSSFVSNAPFLQVRPHDQSVYNPLYPDAPMPPSGSVHPMDMPSFQPFMGVTRPPSTRRPHPNPLNGNVPYPPHASDASRIKSLAISIFYSHHCALTPIEINNLDHVIPGILSRPCDTNALFQSMRKYFQNLNKDANVINQFLNGLEAIIKPVSKEKGAVGLIQQELKESFEGNSFEQNFILQNACPGYLDLLFSGPVTTPIVDVSYNNLILRLMDFSWKPSRIRDVFSKTVMSMRGNVKIELRYFVQKLHSLESSGKKLDGKKLDGKKLAEKKLAEKKLDRSLQSTLTVLKDLGFSSDDLRKAKAFLQDPSNTSHRYITDFNLNIAQFARSLTSYLTDHHTSRITNFLQDIYENAVCLTYGEDFDTYMEDPAYLEGYIKVSIEENAAGQASDDPPASQGNHLSLNSRGFLLSSITLQPQALPRFIAPSSLMSVQDAIKDPKKTAIGLDALHQGPPHNLESILSEIDFNANPMTDLIPMMDKLSELGCHFQDVKTFLASIKIELPPGKIYINISDLYFRLQNRGFTDAAIKTLFLKTEIPSERIERIPSHTFVISEVNSAKLIIGLRNKQISSVEVSGILYCTVAYTPMNIIFLEVLVEKLYKACHEAAIQYSKNTPGGIQTQEEAFDTVKSLLQSLGVPQPYRDGLNFTRLNENKPQVAYFPSVKCFEDVLKRKFGDIYGQVMNPENLDKLQIQIQAALNNSICVRKSSNLSETSL